jgi:hypothetical protein
LKLKYKESIADVIADLGPADQIREMFAGFQNYQYEEVAA